MCHTLLAFLEKLVNGEKEDLFIPIIRHVCYYLSVTKMSTDMNLWKKKTSNKTTANQKQMR